MENQSIPTTTEEVTMSLLKKLVWCIHGMKMWVLNRLRKPQMFTWAENEVALAIKRERLASGAVTGFDYGSTCYTSALKALKSLNKDGHSGFSIDLTRDILNRLITCTPLTPIYDTEDNWDVIYEEPNGDICLQCSRMSALFKYISIDGSVRYADNNQYIAINKHSGVSFHSGLISNIIQEMYPITMPYMPTTNPIKVYCEDLLTDPKNGDFDTEGVLYIVLPDGERINIDRYFKEDVDKNNNFKWTEIGLYEWVDRKVLHDTRQLEMLTDLKNKYYYEVESFAKLDKWKV